MAFVNGLPLSKIQLKILGDEHATLKSAFNQIQNYMFQMPSLFRTNAALVTTDGVSARIVSLTADIERFIVWRTVSRDNIAPKGTPELETVTRGVLEHRPLCGQWWCGEVGCYPNQTVLACKPGRLNLAKYAISLT